MEKNEPNHGTTENVVVINGVSYAGRMTIGSLIKIEQYLGEPLAARFANPKNVGFAEMAAIARYALHPLDDPRRDLSDDEWNNLIDTPDAAGFAVACRKMIDLFVNFAKAQN